ADHAHRRGLARAVGTQETEGLPRLDLEVDAVDRDERAEALGERARLDHRTVHADRRYRSPAGRNPELSGGEPADAPARGSLGLLPVSRRPWRTRHVLVLEPGEVLVVVAVHAHFRDIEARELGIAVGPDAAVHHHVADPEE